MTWQYKQNKPFPLQIALGHGVLAIDTVTGAAAIEKDPDVNAREKRKCDSQFCVCARPYGG